MNCPRFESPARYDGANRIGGFEIADVDLRLRGQELMGTHKVEVPIY